MLALSPKAAASTQRFVEAVKAKLGENLESLIAYGSAVRGGFQDGRSDLNVLIVLRQSTPAAHALLAAAVGAEKLRIEPLIVEGDELAGTVRAFAAKFASIRRNYAVLHGRDAMADVQIDPALERLLTEQGVRNLSLRLAHEFVVEGRERRAYSRYLFEVVTTVITDVSAVLRCVGVEMPKAHTDRIPAIATALDVDTTVLSELLAGRAKPRTFGAEEALGMHARILSIVNAAVRRIAAA
jgi:predicted nucleotidyltransferase